MSHESYDSLSDEPVQIHTFTGILATSVEIIVDPEEGAVQTTDRNTLSYCATVGLAIPPTASLEELREMAKAHVSSAAELEDREKQLIIRLHRLEDDTHYSNDELASDYGVTKQTIAPLENRIMARLRDIEQLRGIIPFIGRMVESIPADGVPVSSISDVLGCDASQLALRLMQKDMLTVARTDRLTNGSLVTWVPRTVIKPFLASILGDNNETTRPNRAAIREERVMSILTQRQADALKLTQAYPQLNQKAVSELLGWTSQGFTKAIRACRAELTQCLPAIESGTFDWESWGEQTKPFVARQNPLVLAAKMRIPIPETATIREVGVLCDQQFEHSHITTDLERKLVAALYKLDGGTVKDGDDLAAISGVSVASTLSNIKRTVAHLRDAVNPRPGHEVTLELPDGNSIVLPILESCQPAVALQVVRMALRHRVVRTDGAMPEADVYASYLSRQLLLDPDIKQLTSDLGEEFDQTVYSMVKALLRYRNAADASFEGYADLDTAILGHYLADVSTLRDMGSAKAAGTAKYHNPSEIKAIHAAHTDMPVMRLMAIIDANPAKPADAILAYKKRVAAALTHFDEHPVVTPGVIRSFAVSYVNNLDRVLDTYAENVKRITVHFSDNPLVTHTVIKVYCRCYPEDPVAAIGSWLTRRSDLIARHKINRDVSAAFLGTIARLAPSSPDLTNEQYVEELCGHVDTYLQGLKRLRSSYAANADFTDPILRRCAREYPLNPVGAAERYFECLSGLREAFKEDEVVEDFVLQYVASRFLSNNLQAAQNKITAWLADYARISGRYQDNLEIDDDTLKVIALYWPDRPSYGLGVIMRNRRTLVDSLDKPINESGMTLLYTLQSNEFIDETDEGTGELS